MPACPWNLRLHLIMYLKVETLYIYIHSVSEVDMYIYIHGINEQVNLSLTLDEPTLLGSRLAKPF